MKDINVNLPEVLADKNEHAKRNKELRKACKEFEAIFTYQLLKSMRNTIEKCDLFHSGQSEEIYESLLDQEYAKLMARSDNNGIAEMLYQQLSRNDISSIENEEAIDDGEKITRNLPQWPIKAKVSSKFGLRKDPFTGEDRMHAGIDIAARKGAVIKASLSGRVVFSEFQEGYGNVVVLDHGHGFTTLYAHNSDNLVDSGDWVEQGSPVARVGSTGRSTGPHLHFEVRRNGKKMDPLEFLDS